MKQPQHPCLKLAAVVGFGLLSSSCAFSPARPSRIHRPQHKSRGRVVVELSSSSCRNDETSSEVACSKNNNESVLDDITSKVQKSIASIGTSAAIVASVLASPINVNVHIKSNNIINNNNNNNAITAIISIERSQAWAITENQQRVGDVWFAVTAQYFDQSFNGLGEDGWRQKEKQAMQQVADTGPDDDEIVTGAIKTMLMALNDPYTRYLPKEKYEALTAYATGSTASNPNGNAGIGVQLLEDPRMKKNVMVMATTKGGPAANAGVQTGDVILRINGESMEGVSAEVVAAKCRGEAGEKVDIDFLRTTDGGSKQSATTATTVEHVTLARAKINPNPIETSTYVSDKGKKVGLLRVPSFSTETVTQIVDGLRSVAATGGEDGEVDVVAIDLRGNVGGYMPAGVDAAKLFLPARSHIIAEVGKSGQFKAYDADGIGAETTLPLYLLVDERTASAAEIFTAALQDNRRALVVGNTNTFGKGRIQNVQPLDGGCGVAVTRARYVTPKGKDIHGVGIEPNAKPAGGRCEANDSARTCLAEIVDMY